MKGHTKIELFNAKTGKLEKTVEDNNMFTNALNSLLNDNIGGDLSDPADIFPLPEKALGGLMLLPEAEEEDVNNLFPHSFPVATGVYGRTDISNNSMMGVYNAEKSGYSPNKESYTHVWEFPTYQGNGTIACAALTHKYGVNAPYDYQNSEKIISSSLVTKQMWSGNAGDIHQYPLTKYNGYLYSIRCNSSGISESANPEFIISKAYYVEDKVQKLKNIPFKEINTNIADVSEDVFTITLPLNYGYYIAWQAFPSESGKAILLASKCELGSESGSYTDGYNLVMTEPFLDVYEINIATQQVNFIRTLNVPIYNKNSGSAQITESGRDVARDETFTTDYYNSMSQGTDYHLVAELTQKSWATNAPHTQPLVGYITTIPYYKQGNIFYKDGYIFYSPIFYEPTTNVNKAIWHLDLFVRINILTNEFELIKCGRGLVKYSIVQLYNDESVVAIGDRVYNVATNTIYYAPSPIVLSSNNSYTTPSRIFFNNGVYCLKEQSGWDCASTSSSKYHQIIRSRNNMYLATINNLPQPLTKSSEQTMRVTYTISNGV